MFLGWGKKRKDLENGVCGGTQLEKVRI